MDKISGSMEALSAVQLTADMEGLDAQSRTLLRSKEVLAVILQGVIPEYQGYNRQEIPLRSGGYTIWPEVCHHSCPW